MARRMDWTKAAPRKLTQAATEEEVPEMFRRVLSHAARRPKPRPPSKAELRRLAEEAVATFKRPEPSPSQVDLEEWLDLQPDRKDSAQ